MKIRDDIAALIHAGHSDRAIARNARTSKRNVAKTRRHLGVPPLQPRSALALDQAWATYAQPTDDGHMTWTGPTNHAGTPVFTHRQIRYSARIVAFKARHKRDPIGYVKAICGDDQCVAPDCVADRPMREQLDNQYNAIFGGIA